MEERGSFIKMQGKMGNLSFDKHHKHGYATWMKGSVDVNHIAPDPAFQRTWGNNAELGRAASTSSKIKQQINNLLLDYGDSQFSNQLPSVMHKIPWDERKSLQANNLMLKNMEMNIAAKRFIMENGNLYYAPHPQNYHEDNSDAPTPPPENRLRQAPSRKYPLVAY